MSQTREAIDNAMAVIEANEAYLFSKFRVSPSKLSSGMGNLLILKTVNAILRLMVAQWVAQQNAHQ